MTITSKDIAEVPLEELLIRHDVDSMSSRLLGLPYYKLRPLIYPHPRYKSFTIKKRNGSDRLIQEPKRQLKEIQRHLLRFLYDRAGPIKPCVHGFTPRRSIVTNAKAHLKDRPRYLLNVDIEEFFPSITFYRVRGLLQKKPFEFSYAVATVLAQLCTFNKKLPQGAPTSPLLANLVCRSLDRDLTNLAKRHRATYTRYADDITFSFSVTRADALPANICTFAGGGLTLGDELKSLFTTNSFTLNSDKNRISTRLKRMQVTGIVINEFPNVRRLFVDRIRGALRAWKSHGYERADRHWRELVQAAQKLPYEKRIWNRQRRTESMPALKNVLWGRLLYLRMVRGKNDPLYARLAERYNGLGEKEQALGEFAFRRLPVEPIVNDRDSAERAIFVVEWHGQYKAASDTKHELIGGQGTAFAYRGKALITCDHVFAFRGRAHERNVEIDISSPDVTEARITLVDPETLKETEVQIEHRDAGRDLAILQFVGDRPSLPRHFVATDQPIERHARGSLVGFPNFSPRRRAHFHAGEVLSRYPSLGLPRFEISTLIYQGNSGGVFVDELYRVAGVAQKSAVPGPGNNECLCITEVDKWLSEIKMS